MFVPITQAFVWIKFKLHVPNTITLNGGVKFSMVLSPNPAPRFHRGLKTYGPSAL